MNASDQAAARGTGGRTIGAAARAVIVCGVVLALGLIAADPAAAQPKNLFQCTVCGAPDATKCNHGPRQEADADCRSAKAYLRANSTHTADYIRGMNCSSAKIAARARGWKSADERRREAEWERRRRESEAYWERQRRESDAYWAEQERQRAASQAQREAHQQTIDRLNADVEEVRRQTERDRQFIDAGGMPNPAFLETLTQDAERIRQARDELQREGRWDEATAVGRFLAAAEDRLRGLRSAQAAAAPGGRDAARGDDPGYLGGTRDAFGRAGDVAGRADELRSWVTGGDTGSHDLGMGGEYIELGTENAARLEPLTQAQEHILRMGEEIGRQITASDRVPRGDPGRYSGPAPIPSHGTSVSPGTTAAQDRERQRRLEREREEQRRLDELRRAVDSFFEGEARAPRIGSGGGSWDDRVRRFDEAGAGAGDSSPNWGDFDRFDEEPQPEPQGRGDNGLRRLLRTLDIVD